MAASSSKKKAANKSGKSAGKPAVKKAGTGKARAAAKPAARKTVSKAAKKPANKKSSNPLGLEKKVPGQFDTLQEIALEAYRKMPAPVWGHLMGGSDSETTLARNRASLDALALRQRVLVDVRQIDMSTSLLGQAMNIPVFPAPVGGFLSKPSTRATSRRRSPNTIARMKAGSLPKISPPTKSVLKSRCAQVFTALIFMPAARGHRARCCRRR